MTLQQDSSGGREVPAVDIECSEPATEEEKLAFADVDLEQLRRLVAYAFGALHLAPETELSIAVIGEQEMERLHLDWMDLDGPTDVMSFPMDELRPGTADRPSEGTLGDIALCPTVAARQARAAGHPTADELCLLTVHGILHCLGFDHGTADEEREMFALQRRILEDFLGHPAPVETRY